MTISSQREERTDPRSIYRMRISGNTAKVVSTTELTSIKNEYQGQLWIQGDTLLSVYHISRGWDVGRWSYPQGGNPRLIARRIGDLEDPYSWGLVLSKTATL
jgi:hypothetical protein